MRELSLLGLKCLKQRVITCIDTCKVLSLLCWYSAYISQVTFISHKHDYYMRISMVIQFLQPSLNVLICQVLGDVVNQQCTHCSSVIPTRAKLFIITHAKTGSVYWLKLCFINNYLVYNELPNN